MGSYLNAALEQAATTFSTSNNINIKEESCVTTRLPLWLLTMDLVCAKLALLEMMPQEQFSPPSLEDQDIKVSWLVWDRRTLMLEMRQSKRGILTLKYPIEHGI